MALELKQSLSLKLTQQLVMTPQLQLAIKLLQLNRLELTELVRQEMLENPMLEQDAEPADGSAGADGEASEVSEPTAEPAPGPAVAEAGPEERGGRESGGLDIPWETMAESYAYQPPGSNVRQGMEELPSYEQTLTRSETLQEHLLWQLQLANLSALERDIGARIIGDIDESGYLKGASITVDDLAAPSTEAAPPAEASAEPAQPEPVLKPKPEPAAATQVLAAIADDLEVPIEWIERVRHRILRFDPIGVGALDLRECLLVQLDQLGYDDDDLVYLIVRDHLRDVERRNYKAIVKTLKVTLEEVGDAIKIITQLEPKPGRSFHPGGGAPEAQYITPDIYVQKVGDEYTILLNEDGLPKLRISRFYRNQLKEAAARGETKSYIRDKLRSATWLIRSIHQRQRTIYKVMDSILRFQRDFFDRGVAHLKPMVLQDVARDIGMHESTISRVTSNKYVHTPQGIFELKYFFNSSIHRTEGDDIASESVKNHIKEIITGEDPKRPLSDAQIVKLLRDRKIEIARRTVAKYREMMGILPSSKRKQIF
ncbi:MAG: RNA polymerase factor sigma-54 [Deltaproteobacteria bacterium]|nr:RNA polymerase factor sigma-54 [Deltaproteobacteria bacterium]